MRKKILLVDDTVTITAIEKAVLGECYDYVEARNGEEALRRAVEECPDLILMDINMPVRNGIDGLRDLKAEGRTAAIPVVMVSTITEEPTRQQCRQLGCAAFVNKPIDGNQLRSMVRRFVGDSG
jgi:CheY-like chemotaxis protein